MPPTKSVARRTWGPLRAPMDKTPGYHLSLAKTAFHRDSLTCSAGAGSLAGLHDSTSLGDHRRAFLGVPLAERPHDREPRPPPAALHRLAEASAADRAGGSGGLGCVAAGVGKV